MNGLVFVICGAFVQDEWYEAEGEMVNAPGEAMASIHLEHAHTVMRTLEAHGCPSLEAFEILAKYAGDDDIEWAIENHRKRFPFDSIDVSPTLEEQRHMDAEDEAYKYAVLSGAIEPSPPTPAWERLVLWVGQCADLVENNPRPRPRDLASTKILDLVKNTSRI